MPIVITTIRIRRRRQRSPRILPGKRPSLVGIGCIAAGVLLFALVTIQISLLHASLVRGLPSPGDLAKLVEPPDLLMMQPTHLYDRSGMHLLFVLENPDANGRQYLPLEAFPPHLRDATIAVSDPTFWTNPGFSMPGLTPPGPRTLAEGLVSNILFWNEPEGLRRSLREKILAAQVTADFGREKVLEWYLNTTDYGKLAFGADAAARAYFDKPATALNLQESALLAAVGQAPALNPVDAPHPALERRNRALRAMLSQGFITAREYDQASKSSLGLRAASHPSPNFAPAFINLVLRDLSARLEPQLLYRSGLRVITTLDHDLQVQATCAARTQLSRLAAAGDSDGSSLDDPECPAARLLPAWIKIDDPTTGIGASLVILDPTNGQLLALVAENSTRERLARLPEPPPGSIVTPFIYLNAFSRGLSPASMLWDIPESRPEVVNDVENPDGNFHGPVRLRLALANDYLVPALQLLYQLGPENVWRTGQEMGLKSLEKPMIAGGYRLLLEGGEMPLLELSQAYGVLANQGVLIGQVPAGSTQEKAAGPVEAVTVLRVQDADGDPLLACSEKLINCALLQRPVISPQLAYLVNHVLSDEPARWPGLGHPNHLEIGRPVAAKIGVTQDGMHAWTAGYTPGLVTVVWLGLLDGNPTEKVDPNSAAGLWHALMKYGTRQHEPGGWPLPAEISTVEVCDPSGLLPTRYCPDLIKEVFLQGNEPNQPDNLFRAYRVNRETGQLATAYTPTGLLEERVYMLFPPEAHQWATQMGYPLPPESYDSILYPTIQDYAHIFSPPMFATISGALDIYGSASGPEFDSYRLQVGQGLNPLQWYMIGEDSRLPVESGLLGSWDTTGWNGLYALQLLVRDRNSGIQTGTIFVTVDNRAPQVSIRYPRPGQRISYPQESIVTFIAGATDDLEVAEVEFYLDEQLLKIFNMPPYALPWRTRLGEYILRVRVIDQASNASEASISFIVER